MIAPRLALAPLSAVLALAFALSIAAACATIRQPPAGALRVTTNVPDATLVIDDVVMGRVASWAEPRGVRAGFHRIEVRHTGHFAYFAEVTIREGQTVALNAHLHPLLD